MTRRRNLPPVPGKNHADPLSYWERYAHEARKNPRAYYAHLTADGKPWCLAQSTERPTREQAIQTYMTIPITLVFGAWPTQTRFTYHASREEAEQHVPRSMFPHETHEPPTEDELRRPLCAASEPWAFRRERDQQEQSNQSHPQAA